MFKYCEIFGSQNKQMLSIPYQDRYQFELSANCSIQLAFEVEEKKYVQLSQIYQKKSLDFT